MATTSWNVNAHEFTPSGVSVDVEAPVKLRVDAPVFVPLSDVPVLASSKSSLTLHEELFGDPAEAEVVSAAPVSVLTTMKQHISTILVHQLLGQADKQVLELGSFLANHGMQTSSQDLILIRLQLQQLQSLKTSLNSVLSPVPTIGGQRLIPVPGGAIVAAGGTKPHQSQYTALLSHALKQQPVGSKFTVPPSTCTSGAALSMEDLCALVYRVIEKTCVAQNRSVDACNLGVSVGNLSAEWTKFYPSLSPLEFYTKTFKIDQLKDLLTFDKSLVLFYSSLPFSHLRVSTRTHFQRNLNPNHSSAKLIHLWTKSSHSSVAPSPLISPTSTCSFTSDVVVHEEYSLPSSRAVVSDADLEQIFTQTLIKVICVGLKQKNSIFSEILKLVEETERTRKRLLDSRRPPPIETGGSTNAATQQHKHAEFRSRLLSDEFFARFVKNSDVVSMWKVDFPSVEFPSLEIVGTYKSIKVLGDQCGLVQFACESAIDAMFTSLVWNQTNMAQLVTKFMAPPMTQLSELSSILFKSIMAGGQAAECASALKVLAAKDPSAIHEIVSQHISQLKQAKQVGTTSGNTAAANAFVTELMNRGKNVKESLENQTRNHLLNVKRNLSERGELTNPPPEMKNLKLSKTHKK